MRKGTPMPRMWSLALSAGLAALAFPPCVSAEDVKVLPIAPDAASATSAAVVVPGSTPLAHTAQVLPLDGSGKVVKAGDAGAQAEAVLDHLEACLRDARSGLDRLVKVHLYATNDEALRSFRDVFAKRVAGK